MKAQKLRELNGSELTAQAAGIEEQMFRIRFQMSMGQTEGLKKLRVIKKDRARMLGILRERELDPARKEAAAALESSSALSKRSKTPGKKKE